MTEVMTATTTVMAGDDDSGDLAELQRLVGAGRVDSAARGWARARGGAAAEVVGARLAPPSTTLEGFLGVHRRAELLLRDAAGALHAAPLFIKTVPRPDLNPHKAEFIEQGGFFHREALVYALLAEADALCPAAAAAPWRPAAYHCDERVVMLEELREARLAPPGPLDLAHLRLACGALAGFHAAVAALEEARGPQRRLPREHADALRDNAFRAGPWLSAAGGLVAALLAELGGRGGRDALAAAVTRRFERACDTLRHAEGTLNVLVHRDCWHNNVLFEYGAGAPRRAYLLDYQCVQYAPPALDVMLLLYLTTDRAFRRRHEADVLAEYWAAWERAAAARGGAAARARRLGYDREEYLRRCGAARCFALAAACCIAPYTLMDAAAARCFDEPASFRRLTLRDRSGPVLAHAASNPHYRRRLLELAQEFEQRYILEDDYNDAFLPTGSTEKVEHQ